MAASAKKPKCPFWIIRGEIVIIYMVKWIKIASDD
jgi:hypothetical protein